MNSLLNPEAPEFHPPITTVVQDAYLQTHKTIRISNRFPIGTSYDLFTTFTDFNSVTCMIRKNVVIQSNQIMVKEMPAVKLKCDGDDENNTEKIIDANDSFLDRININIDTLSGVNEPSASFVRNVQTAAWNRAPVIATIKVNGESAMLIGAKNIPRPQILFKEPVDNSDKLFMPRIFDKPNSIKPLALSILYNAEGQPVGYEHPYKTELDAWEPPPAALAEAAAPTFPADLESTPLTLVDSEPRLEQLLLHLARAPDIAVDLEHHSYRTYQGITCLIQISTDEGGDFIVDALALREHIHKLNDSFTNPNKIKVFHGAKNDIQWLQRDFGVYVVGLFDTHLAARALRLPALSLKYLLQHYCRVEADKTFQLADWRMRPLPAELVRYARADTHYLLYVWRRMRAELLAADARAPRLLRAVFHGGRGVCGATYNKPVVDEESHLPLYLRSQKRFSAAQLAALRVLFRWRDRQARELDESTTYLLPNHMLLALAEKLPRELQGMRAVCVPPPPFLMQHAEAVHRMILSCRELPDEPQLYGMPAGVRGMLAPPRPQRSAHDLAHFPDRSSEPIDLDAATRLALARAAPGRADVPALDAGAAAPRLARLAVRAESRLNADAQMFIPPYDRYKMYRAIHQAGELKDLKEKEAKVAAISKGNELIREEVLAKLQRAHIELAHEGAAAEGGTAAAESGTSAAESGTSAAESGTAAEGGAAAESGTSAEGGAAAPAPAPASRNSSGGGEQTMEIIEKKNKSQRKRKIIERSEQKDSVNQTTESEKNKHKTLNKNDSNVKPFFYKNVNYKKFYSDNEKGHKQPKMKFKKS